jgi:hypothetical protein
MAEYLLGVICPIPPEPPPSRGPGSERLRWPFPLLSAEPPLLSPLLWRALTPVISPRLDRVHAALAVVIERVFGRRGPVWASQRRAGEKFASVISCPTPPTLGLAPDFVSQFALHDISTLQQAHTYTRRRRSSVNYSRIIATRRTGLHLQTKRVSVPEGGPHGPS